MATGETGRLLTALGGAGAVALVVAVWLVPLPGTDDPSGAVVRIGPGSSSAGANTSTVQAVGATPDHNWLTLAEPLSALREPIVVQPPQGGGDPPPPPPPPPPSFRYIGLITAGGRTSALLDMNGTQRFVSVGDTITDAGRDDLVVQEITPEKVVFQRGEVTTTITRETRRPTPSTPAGQSPPPLPGSPPTEDQMLRGELR